MPELRDDGIPNLALCLENKPEIALSDIVFDFTIYSWE